MPGDDEEQLHDDPIHLAWAELLEHWTDPAAHRRFLNLASGLGRLADAGARYRRATEDAALRREAQVQIERLLSRAVVEMQGALGPPVDPRERYRALRFVAWTLSLTLIILVIVAYRASH